MKILVTGGAGFIGSHLANALQKSGHDAAVFDIASGSDIRNKAAIEKAASGCDAVFHLAAQTDVQASIKNPALDYSVNVAGTQNVVDACIGNGIKKLIFTSSAAVYGDAPVPVKEDCQKKPLSPYGKNKLMAEKIVSKIKDACIFRLFNVYGAGAKSAINRFCMCAREGKDIVLLNDGTHTRDYIYIDDVVSALMLGMNHSGIYNVGSGIETTTNDLIKIISDATGMKLNVAHGKPVNEIERSAADVTKIKALGWSPKVSLRDGISRILKNKE